MRVAVLFVFCLTLHNIVGQTGDFKPESDCEDLTARIEEVKKSTRSRKEKFSCFLNLLKNALADELENFIDTKSENDDVSDKTNVTNTHNEENKEINDNENDVSIEKDLFDKLELQTEKKECRNNTNWNIPTMIPIFKPKPVINDKNPLENSQLIPKPEAIQANQSPPPKYPPFTIPCQRAADILDMSVIPRERTNVPMREVNLHVKKIVNDALVLPREIICDERREANVPRYTNLQPRDRDIVNDIPREINIQPGDLNTQTRDLARGIINEVKQQSNLNFGAKKLTAEESPKTLAVHCKDADESVAVLFKPKAITLEQLYGNLLKKLTITVLVPYHMSKLGKMCDV